MGGVSAHEFYFAYAELSYNEFTNNLEGTLIFSTHDLEKAIEPNGSLIGLFDKLEGFLTFNREQFAGLLAAV